MSFAEIFATIVSSLGLSIGGAWYLAKTLVESRMKLLEQQAKAALDAELQKAKIELETEKEKGLQKLKESLRLQTDIQLAERTAELEYRLEAKKRLYLRIGPLRVQLAVACRAVANRVASAGFYAEKDPHEQIFLEIDAYYAKSTIYNLLRPLSLLLLAERQLAFADFSVDEKAIDLLRLKRALSKCLSSEDVLPGDVTPNWEEEIEHVYSGHVGRAATRMLVHEGEVQRVIEYSELDDRFSTSSSLEHFAPFPRLIREFSLAKRPITWIRLCAFGFICGQYCERYGDAVGLPRREFPLEQLLALREGSAGDEASAELRARFADLF